MGDNHGVRIAAALLLLCPSLAAAQPSSPGAAEDKTLVITAPAAPGGGWDQTARAMQRVLGDVEPGANVQVDNVPGAAGTIGLARFIQSERGNPNALLVTGLVMVSGVIINGSPVSLSNATPIARLTGEYEVIVVPAASPYRSITDVVAAFKSDPGAIAWGGGSAGGTDDLLVRLLAEQIGIPASRVNYIAFSGGGAALAAVLSGQLAAAVSGYAEFSGQIAAGQLRVLAISSPSRINGIDAPTLRESGIALDLANWRAVVAPPGLSETEQAALTARVSRMAASPQWHATLERNEWDDQFLSGPSFRQFLLAEQSRIEDVLRRLAAADEHAPSPLSLSLTPMTLPAATGIVFLFALAGVIVQLRGRSITLDPTGMRMLGAAASALAVLPLVFVTIGFVAASTLLFVAIASAVRGQPLSMRAVALDGLAGALFAAILFAVFTRALGVMLPGPHF